MKNKTDWFVFGNYVDLPVLALEGVCAIPLPAVLGDQSNQGRKGLGMTGSMQRSTGANFVIPLIR